MQNIVEMRFGGPIENRDVSGYPGEAGVEHEQLTETFVHVTAWIGNWRWAAFLLIFSYGELAQHRREVVIHYRRFLISVSPTIPRIDHVFWLELNADG